MWGIDEKTLKEVAWNNMHSINETTSCFVHPKSLHIPVSYTHLDVYKRQAENRPQRRSDPCTGQRSYRPARHSCGADPAEGPVCRLCIGQTGGLSLIHISLTRGLGGPVKRTNICKLGFHVQDVIFLLICLGAFAAQIYVPVSYTHLDVYKRQLRCWTA